MRTATSPCRRTAPSSRGATSRTSPVSDSGQPGTVVRDGGPQLGQLLGDPHLRGAAARVARGDRALDGEHVAHRGRQVYVDGGELLVGQLVELAAELLAAAHARAGHLVG